MSRRGWPRGRGRCYWRQRGASWPRVRGTGGEHRANLCCRLQSGDAVEAQRFGGKRPDRKEETPMAEPKDSKQFPTEIGDAFIEERFWAVRGRAIQAYAKLEQALCLIFATLCDMPPDVAGIIFFRIVNAGTLHSILERLMKKKHGTTYSSFWGSFLDAIRGTSQRRNEIVHWMRDDVRGRQRPPAGPDSSEHLRLRPQHTGSDYRHRDGGLHRKMHVPSTPWP